MTLIIVLIAVAVLVGCYFWLGTSYTTGGGTTFNPTLIVGIVLAAVVGLYFLLKWMKRRK
jgi:hypothetical protein